MVYAEDVLLVGMDRKEIQLFKKLQKNAIKIGLKSKKGKDKIHGHIKSPQKNETATSRQFCIQYKIYFQITGSEHMTSGHNTLSIQYYYMVQRPVVPLEGRKIIENKSNKKIYRPFSD